MKERERFAFPSAPHRNEIEENERGGALSFASTSSTRFRFNPSAHRHNNLQQRERIKQEGKRQNGGKKRRSRIRRQRGRLVGS